MYAGACPCCGGTEFAGFLPEREIAKEIDIRRNFVWKRLGRRPDSAEAMDLTEFMHGGAGRLRVCTHCGVVRREEAAAAHYEDDLYDPALIAHLYPQYLRAFREKAPHYRQLLNERSNVIELGSHFGAFLQTAEEWNWRPIGVDIGAYTSAFARRQGFTVRRQSLPDFSPRGGPSDALFIWNCFEQIERPTETLINAHRVLKPYGLLVVRVPNLSFYAGWRQRVGNRPESGAVQRLGYNNLLGFPYRFGYTSETLTRLLRRWGFEPIAHIDANLLTMPLPEMPRWVRQEYSAVRQQPADPWIEIVSRRSAA